MALPRILSERLTIPAIAAPMTTVSGPELVIAACRSGVVGSFPTHNAASTDQLDHWLYQIHAALDGSGRRAAPVAPNLVVHRTNERLRADLDCLVRHRVELVITSVGSPKPVIAPLHDIGCLVFADVAGVTHAQRALEAGVDGLVLLTAGAGGQTGWANPFAFVRAVRRYFDGPIVLAGGISDGTSILAAQVLGADLAYLGTRFIATSESNAGDDYKAALIGSTLDDVRLSTRVGGIPASLLASWLALDDAAKPDAAESGAAETGADDSAGFAQERLLRNRTAWSAGHSVAGVDAITSVADLVDTIAQQYAQARHGLFGRLVDGGPSAGPQVLPMAKH
ncbi:nitronate monooxygenase [Nocardia sp. R6R-6]|uniref:nitronate monooxygenase n=1 Tax=Nocardia sp. R6R-6 TaxID=3459303 RepID=UPI00403DDED7